MKITVGVLSIRQFLKMKRGAFSALLSLALTLLTLHASHSSILAQDVADAQPDAMDAAPEFLDLSDADRMAVGGGFLHWSFYDNPPRVQSAAPDSASAFGYIKRRPLNGGAVATLSTNPAPHIFLHANDLGVYYYHNGAITLRRFTNPYVDEPLIATAQPDGLVSDASTRMMYWLAGGKLWFAYRDHATATQWDMANAGADPHDLVVGADSYLYWFGDGVLYRVFKGCLFNGSACIRDTIAVESGRGLHYQQVPGVLLGQERHLHWVSGSNIRSYGCDTGVFPIVCGVSTIYTSPPGSFPAVGVGGGNRLVGAGDDLFWVEIGGGAPPELKRHHFAIFGGDTDTIVGGQDSGVTNIRSALALGNGWVHFAAADNAAFFRIMRIRTDAPPILPDLAAGVAEVTQGIQNSVNDAPLVAHKPTWVRGYANKLSGPRAGNVTARLDGFRNGQLIGSIRPTNNALTFPLPSGLGGSNVPDRTRPDHSWNFALPDQWTAPGQLVLNLVVNADRIAAEPDTRNNVSTATVDFLDKAPICTVFIRVRTARTAALFTPEHWFAIAMAEKLLPTPELWTFAQASDVAELEARFGIPPWEYGPYELADDGAKIIAALWLRDQLSDDPDECDDANARTHYVGVIDPGERGVNGQGNLGGDQLIFRLPPVGAGDWKHNRSPTFAHELGHNYGRRHVDCPAGDPDDTGGYPYPACDLDFDDGTERHYGFVMNPRWNAFEVILPTAAGDLMSYAHRLPTPKPRWSSDFSWRGLLQEMPNREYGAQRAIQMRTLDLAAAGEVVILSGSVDTARPQQSILNHAWVYPTAEASQNLLSKWQHSLTPAYVQVQSSSVEANYHVRLLAADGTVLADQQISLFETNDGDSAVKAFGLTLAAPAGEVEQIDLLDGETVLAANRVGGNAPEVTILQPAGASVIEDSMTVQWTANDPDVDDALLFTVQYSPDDGATWQTLIADYAHIGAGETVTLQINDVLGIPASSVGRVRVAASDGYHTTWALSEPFTVLDRGPRPTILAPDPDHPIASAATIVASGTAMDSEDGRIPGASLAWAITGPINTTLSASGAQIGLPGLGPGVYNIALTATDSAGLGVTKASTFTVAPLSIPAGPAPILDGFCDDDAYASAARLSLRPYADATQASVFVTRTGAYLWACFVDLKRAGGSSPGSFATVRVDSANDRAATPQADDYEFHLFEDGVPGAKQGDGNTFVSAPPSGVQGQVSADATHWSAELIIPAAMFNDWAGAVGLDFDHNWVNAQFDDYRWPHYSDWWNPATWAESVFTAPPLLTALHPVSGTVGSPNVEIVLSGSGFVDGAWADWNGTAITATSVHTDTLRAVIPGELLTQAGVFPMRVVNPGLEAAPSAPQFFRIDNPVPTITAVDFDGATLAVQGIDFVDGAKVIWNGLEETTTFLDSGHLQAEIDPTLIPLAGEVAIVVANPEPSRGQSAVWPLEMGEAQGPSLFLPLVQR